MLTKEEKNANFKRIAYQRVGKIVQTINSLKNLDNIAYYEYSKEDLVKLRKLVRDETERVFDFLLNKKLEG